MKRVAMSLVLLTMVASVVGLELSAPSAQTAPQKVVFALNWFPVGAHAAYWVALEKGYYRQRGLDVDLQNSKGSGDSIAKVDSGRADVGLADRRVVIAAAARGAKVKVVGMIFKNSPLNWRSRPSPSTSAPRLPAPGRVAAP